MAGLFKNFPHLLHGCDYNPEQWLAYPNVLRKDIELMQEAGINCVSMGIFSWSHLEPYEGRYEFDWLDERFSALEKAGIMVVLATPSGARPVWMDEKYPSVRRVAQNRVRDLRGGRHNHCYTSPIYRQKVFAINDALAARYGKKSNFLLWHLSNEYSGECHCYLCQEAFREWLRARYENDIEKLNHAYWSSFWSRRYTAFEQIESPAENGEYSLHGLKIDWKRFCNYQTNEFIKTEIEAIRGHSEAPITTNNMGTFDGLDLWKQSELLDLVSWDSYPQYNEDAKEPWTEIVKHAFAHDLNRGLKNGKPFLLMESTPSQTNWHITNGLKPPGLHMLMSMSALAHGSDSVQYFQWRKGRGGYEKFHGAVVSHHGSSNTRVFREVSQVGVSIKTLDNLGIVGTSVNSEVGIFWDWENLWAVSEYCGHQNNIYERRNYTDTVLEHYRAFWENGISCDVVGPYSDYSKYKILVVPMQYMLTQSLAEKLAAYARNGGILVATYLLGYVDENDLVFMERSPGFGLSEVFGVKVEETDALYSKREFSYGGHEYELRDYAELMRAENSATTLASYLSGFYTGNPLLTVNPYGKGFAYYMAARPSFDFLKAFYEDLADEAGIAPPIGVKKIPPGVSISARSDGNKKYIFIMNFTKEKKRLIIRDGVQYKDVLTGELTKKILSLPEYGLAILAPEI